jgi:hypothetical protein
MYALQCISFAYPLTQAGKRVCSSCITSEEYIPLSRIMPISPYAAEKSKPNLLAHG